MDSNPSSDFPPEPRHARRCPDCGSPVRRIGRTANDRRRWDAEQWHRYQCTSERCHWQGLLRVVEHPPHRAHRSDSRTAIRLMNGLLAVVAAIALLGAGIAALRLLTAT